MMLIKQLEEVIDRGTEIVRHETQMMGTDLTTQAKSFAPYGAKEAARALMNKTVTLRQILMKTMATLESMDMLDNGGSSNNKNNAIA